MPASDGKAVPKSGHMANSEAKVCADAIVRSFTGEVTGPGHRNQLRVLQPNHQQESSWLSANFIYGDIYEASGNVKRKGMHRVDAGEAAQTGRWRQLPGHVHLGRQLFADSFV